ncbi:MAG: SurA N-terminal domain-containing protein, partial [Desulfovibrionaceae bacterium]
MNARRRLGLAALFLAAAMALAGCESSQQAPGVVARVNGRPIMLRQLEFKYDLKHMDSVSDPVPSVEELRQEYGEILGDLIVKELVFQALEERGLSVTAEELEQAEQIVRADYPDGAFEQVLVEEYIDLTAWREQLRYRLALDKLFRQVLRPRIKLDYKMAEDYYRKHIHDFHQPERWTLFVLTGPDPR